MYVATGGSEGRIGKLGADSAYIVLRVVKARIENQSRCDELNVLDRPQIVVCELLGETTVIATGTFSTFSERRCAVTIISARSELALCSGVDCWAKPGDSAPRPNINPPTAMSLLIFYPPSS